MSQAKRIHVSNFFGTRNKGDEAMLRGLIALLRGRDGPLEISVSRFYFDPVGEKQLPDLSFCASLGARKNRFDSVCLTLVFILAYLGLRRAFEIASRTLRPHCANALAAIKCAGSVYVTGGPFFSATFRKIFALRIPTFNLAVPLIELYAARLYGKDIVILGQSFGCLEGTTTRWLLKPLLKSVRLISARESKSRDYMERQLSVGDRLIVHPDLAFAIPIRPDRPRNTPPVVAINARRMRLADLRYLFGENVDGSEAELYGKYVETVSGALRGILEHSSLGRFLFLNQARDSDRFAAQDIVDCAGLGGGQVDIQQDGTTLECMLGSIAEAEFVISTRYHSMIFSIIAGTPFCALGYSPKIAAALQDYGLGGQLLRADKMCDDAIVAAYLARKVSAAKLIDCEIRFRSELEAKLEEKRALEN